MKNFKLVYHGGSKNHGCEAIVRSTYKIMNTPKNKLYLYSFNPQQDKSYKLDKFCYIEELFNTGEKSLIDRVLGKVKKVFLQDYSCLYNLNIFKNCKESIFFSIGGDNYSEYNYSLNLTRFHKIVDKKKQLSVLWGCSIEPNLLKHKDIIEDMKLYSLIAARESITYNALLEAGVTENIKLFPDPAFTLETIKCDLPEGFIENKTIGINMSPLIQRIKEGSNIVYDNYYKLIEHIINDTDNNIALIPHVVWKENNDLEPLTKLYNEFKDTRRVVLIQDHNCMELKGFIARCKMFIGARTHATIAAYSSCIPTLVVGYSVKAKGIARDIFGSEENMIIPVQSLKHDDDLLNAFRYIEENEHSIKKHLEDFMPSYKEKAWKAGEEVKKLMGN